MDGVSWFESKEKKMSENIDLEVKKYMDAVKKIFSEKLESAEFDDLDGEKIISAMPVIPHTLWGHFKHEMCDVIKTKETGYFDHYVITYTIRTHILSLEYSSYWQSFFDEVKRLAKIENIEVEPVVCFLSNNYKGKLLKESDFPMRIQKKVKNSGKYITNKSELDDIGFSHESLVLRIRAICIADN